jgi:hypothetical protein
MSENKELIKSLRALSLKPKFTEHECDLLASAATAIEQLEKYAEENKFEKLYDAIMDELGPYVKQDGYGPLESEAECIKRIVCELNAYNKLRAHSFVTSNN